MTGLIYKEFMQNRQTLLILSAVSLMFSLTLIYGGGDTDGYDTVLALIGLMFYVFMFFIVGMMQTKVLEPDETKRWANFIASTPKTEHGQVEAKYIFTLMISVGTYIWCFVLNCIQVDVNNSPNVSGLLLILFFCQIFFRALEMPFLIRFGTKVGAKYKGACFMLLVLVIIGYLLFGDLSIYGNIEKFYDRIFKLLAGEIPDGLYFAISVFPYAAGLLYYLSYRISAKLYLKGAENFDR